MKIVSCMKNGNPVQFGYYNALYIMINNYFRVNDSQQCIWLILNLICVVIPLVYYNIVYNLQQWSGYNNIILKWKLTITIVCTYL